MRPDTFYLREVHGEALPNNRKMDEVSLEENTRIAKAVMIISAADGQISETERDYFIGMVSAFGAPPPQIEELRKFDTKDARLEDYIGPELRPMARHFLYDAIRVSRIDGYHEKERAAVRKSARLIGIDESIVTAIEGLVEIEASVRDARVKFLSAAAS